jgi:hypothetical protein
MTIEEARKIVGKGSPRWTLRHMVKALEMHSWNNTPAEDLRLKAAKLILKEEKKMLGKLLGRSAPGSSNNGREKKR